MPRRRTRQPAPPRTFNVYVIDLDPEILNNRRFRRANPDHDPEKPCVYIGSTFRSPAERFQQHRAGVHSARFAHQYGRFLRPRLYRRFNPLATREEAEEQERALARLLKDRGYAVWQN